MVMPCAECAGPEGNVYYMIDGKIRRCPFRAKKLYHDPVFRHDVVDFFNSHSFNQGT